MAVEEKVVIRVEVDPDLAPLAKVHAALRALGAEEKRLNKNTDKFGKSIDGISRKSKAFESIIKGVSNAFAKMFSITAKFNFIGMAADIGFVALSLGAVKLALMAGRFAAQAYQVALQGIGVVAAGVAGALGTVAAAVNEFNQMSLAPFVGGFRNAASAVRGVMGDDLLSFFGMEGLNGAITELAKSGEIAAAQFPTILRGLGNFAQDGKQLASLAGIFAQINKEGKVTESTLGSLVGSNPVFASAIAEMGTGKVLTGMAAQEAAADAVEAGKITADIFGKAFTGELESTNAWEGQLERMAGTLQGMVMGLMTRMTSLFTDFGKPFLAPFKEAIMDIEDILTSALGRMRSSVSNFGVNAFIPGIVGAIETFANFIVRMSNETLPKLEGFIGKLGEWFAGIENFFRNVGAVLGPLEEGANVMIKMFGPFLRGLFGAKGLGGLIMASAESFDMHSDAMERMGKAWGDFAFAFMGIFRDLQESFFSGSDTIAELFEVLAHNVMPVIREMLNVFRDIMREALPVINDLLKEMSTILLPILQALSSVIGMGGPMGSAGLFAMMASRRGGMGAGKAGAMGAGAALMGPMGMLMGGGLWGAGKKAMGGAGSGMMRSLNPNAGRHIASSAPKWLAGGAGTSALAGMTSLPGLLLGGGIGFGANLGGEAMAKSGAGMGGTVAATAGGGLLAGAGAGALIGMAGGPIGAVAGAVIGLLAGAIGGAMGHSKVTKLKESANKFADETVEALVGEFERSWAKGTNAAGIQAARDALNQLTSDEAITDFAKQYETSFEDAEAIMEEKTRSFNSIIEQREGNYNKSMEALMEITGKTEDQVAELANVMAVDLTDGFNTLMQDLYDLELALNPEDARAAIVELGELMSFDVVRGPNSFLGKRSALEEAATMEEELNGMFDTFRASAAAGDMGAANEALINMMDTTAAIAQLKFGSEGTELMTTQADLIAQLTDPTSPGYAGPEGAAYAKNVALDIEKEDRAILGGTSEIWDPLKASVDALALATGDKETFNWEKVFAETITPQLDPENLGNVTDIAAQSLEIFTGAQFMIATAGDKFAYTVTTGANSVYATFVSAAAAFASGVAGAAVGLRNAALNAGMDAGRHSSTGKGSGATPPPPSNNNAPSDFNHRGGDTATSRFGRVMGFHNAMSRSIGGKFSVTSGVRGFGLGSPSSDHTTGGAFDLTGENLGQYALNTKAMGGFAEFHGSSGSRHLHVVPPIGDTATPAMLGSGGGSGGNSIHAPIYISGAEDPDIVAEKVVQHIQKAMRDESERR